MPSLTQNWMRDYDPTTGRYMQADPVGLVDGASVYGYAGQSPQVNADPTGLCWNIHSNACKAVNKARLNATLARMDQGANAYAAASAGYAVGMAGADSCITADELGSAAVTVALDLAFGKLFGLVSAGMKAVPALGLSAVAKKGIPDSAIVVRGGNQANQRADKINASIGPSRTPGVEGFSAQCDGGTCTAELGRFLRNREIGVTTAGDIRRVGGDVIVTPGLGHHVTVVDLSGEAASPLFKTITNPNPARRP